MSAERKDGMAEMATLVDQGVQSSIITGLSQEAVAASSSRTRRWDQLSEDSASLWAVAMTSPTIFAAQGIRMLNGTPTTAPLQAPLPQGQTSNPP